MGRLKCTYKRTLNNYQVCKLVVFAPTRRRVFGVLGTGCEAWDCGDRERSRGSCGSCGSHSSMFSPGWICSGLPGLGAGGSATMGGRTRMLPPPPCGPGGGAGGAAPPPPPAPPPPGGLPGPPWLPFSPSRYLSSSFSLSFFLTVGTHYRLIF